MENTQNTKSKDKIYLGGLAVLALILIVLAWMYFSERNENKRYIAEITTEKVQLENELRGLSQDYDSLQTSNDTLNIQLKNEQQKITELLERMRVFRNNSYAEINRYKKELGTLKQVLRSYVVQIDSLNTRNKALTAENTRVKKQISWVKEQNKQLEQTTESMKEVISKASTLEAMNLTCYPINKKGKTVRKITKTVKLKSEFTLSKNVTTSTGAKMIYMRITRPDEVVLSNPENLLFKFENADLAYSARREIDYEGERLDVAIFWDNDGSLIKGEYTVDIFTEGNHIGSAKFTLK
jgi:FtsZ-binding cell division protein ZapB